MPGLLLISGSVRARSTNTAALAAIAEAVPQARLYGGLADLPHFNPDLDVDPPPSAVAALRAAIAAADALLFCTPEYAGALPGSFKNLLDWTIGGGEMSGKPVGWINCSDRGAAGAHAELATVLRYADTRPVPEACVHLPVSRSSLTPAGEVADEQLRSQLADTARALLVPAARRSGTAE